MLAKLIVTLICIALLGGCFLFRKDYPRESPTKYVSWGIDEYEFFGLTSSEVQQRFKGDLHFNEKVTEASFNETKNECKDFVGPTFKLTYENGKITGVQRVFEACNYQFIGPVLNSKKEALLYAIKGLTGTKNLKDQEKLLSAKSELDKIK